MEEIKEEDFRIIADQMSTALSSATENMICGTDTSCDVLEAFKDQVEAENSVYLPAIETTTVRMTTRSETTTTSGEKSFLNSISFISLLAFVHAQFA